MVLCKPARVSLQPFRMASGVESASVREVGGKPSCFGLPGAARTLCSVAMTPRRPIEQPWLVTLLDPLSGACQCGGGLSPSSCCPPVGLLSGLRVPEPGPAQPRKHLGVEVGDLLGRAGGHAVALYRVSRTWVTSTMPGSKARPKLNVFQRKEQVSCRAIKASPCEARPAFHFPAAEQSRRGWAFHPELAGGHYCAHPRGGPSLGNVGTPAGGPRVAGGRGFWSTGQPQRRAFSHLCVQQGDRCWPMAPALPFLGTGLQSLWGEVGRRGWQGVRERV